MKRRELGQGLAEFGLLLPVFLLVAMMIIDVGRVVYYYSVVYNAAREGARVGVIDFDQNKITNAARHLASGILDGQNITQRPCLNTTPTTAKIESREYTVTGTYLEAYEAVEVAVCYEFRAATPFLGLITGSPGNNTIFLKSRATMRLEQQN